MSDGESFGERNGWKVTLGAGLVPLFAGISSWVSTSGSFAHPTEPFQSALGPIDFTVGELATRPDLVEYFRLVSSVGAVNVIAAAVYVMIVSIYGLRARQRWAWYALAFSLLWVGLNDAIAATRFFQSTGLPFLLAPWTFVTLMTVGLGLSARSVFGAAPDSLPR